MIKCEGCNKPATYIVYDQPHCRDCILDAIECDGIIEVRWIENADGHPHQSE